MCEREREIDGEEVTLSNTNTYTNIWKVRLQITKTTTEGTARHKKKEARFI